MARSRGEPEPADAMDVGIDHPAIQKIKMINVKYPRIPGADFDKRAAQFQKTWRIVAGSAESFVGLCRSRFPGLLAKVR